MSVFGSGCLAWNLCEASKAGASSFHLKACKRWRNDLVCLVQNVSLFGTSGPGLESLIGCGRQRQSFPNGPWRLAAHDGSSRSRVASQHRHLTTSGLAGSIEAGTENIKRK
jgi:hypothetical protein